jgi:DNA repair exonuclease SbcCD ATPase subunit
MGELADTIQEAAEQAHEHPHSLNSRVGVAVAISATVMALTNIVGGEVVQEMNLTASEVNNAWAYFQAKSTKEHLAENSMQLLEAQGDLTPSAASVLKPKLDRYRSDVARYEKEKTTIQKQAEALEGRRSLLEARAGRFGIAEAAFSLSLALFGLTALTQKKWLLGLGLVFATAGLLASTSAVFSVGLRHPPPAAELTST